jgi:hypothetical protein
MIQTLSLRMNLRSNSLALLVLCLAFQSLSTLHAGLVPNGGDLPTDLNNALRFDPATPTPAIVAFKDANLPLDRYIQIGFSTTNSAAFNVASIGWSKDNVSYTAFSPNDFVNNIVSGGGVKMSGVIDLGSPIGGNASTLFYLRYTLPAGIEVGSVVQSIFYANSNGALSNGILADQFDNNFVTVTRSHTAVPEPTSLLLVSSAAVWLRWRAKRRSKRST